MRAPIAAALVVPHQLPRTLTVCPCGTSIWRSYTPRFPSKLLPANCTGVVISTAAAPPLPVTVLLTTVAAPTCRPTPVLLAIRLPEMYPVLATTPTALPTKRLRVAVTFAPALRPGPDAPSTELPVTSEFAPTVMPSLSVLLFSTAHSPAVMPPSLSVLLFSTARSPAVMPPSRRVLSTTTASAPTETFTIKSPCPSWPYSLSPQHFTPPTLVTAQV